MVHEGKKLFKCDICDPIFFITAITLQKKYVMS